MSYVFNAEEVFSMSVEMEKNGEKFYRKAAEGVGLDKKQKELLIMLADMEKQHIKDFTKIKDELITKKLNDVFQDSENLDVLYLKALVDTKVFFDKKINTSSLKEILKDAIMAEKEAVVFYLGIKNVMPDDLGKNKVDAIIKEEMSHIKLLSNELIKCK